MGQPRAQLTRAQREGLAAFARVSVKDICTNDGRVIRTMAFIGTGVCCEDCRKERDGDTEPFRTGLNP